MHNIISYLSHTMLIERFIGASVYAALLGFFYIKIKNAGNINNIGKLLRLYIILLSIMAFFYIPAESADLYRWRILSESWKNMPLNYFWEQLGSKVSTPIGYLLIYVCQKTGINGILPAICAIIFYHNTFYIVKESARDSNNMVHNESDVCRYTAIGLLFVMCTGRFLEVITGVRCMVAFSIVAKAVYCEIFKKRTLIKSILPYLIACLIHSAAIPLVAIRLFSMMFEREGSILKRLINFSAFAIILFLSFRFGTDYLDATMEKANAFISNNIYSYSWEYITAGIQLLLMIGLLIKYYKYYQRGRTAIHNISRLVLITSIIELLLIRSYSIFHRFIGFSSFIVIPLVLYIMYHEEKSGHNVSIRNFKIICMLLLFVSCLRGNLCAYKFFIF